MLTVFMKESSFTCLEMVSKRTCSIIPRACIIPFCIQAQSWVPLLTKPGSWYISSFFQVSRWTSLSLEGCCPEKSAGFPEQLDPPELLPMGAHIPVPWKSQRLLAWSPRSLLCYLLSLLSSRPWSPPFHGHKFSLLIRHSNSKSNGYNNSIDFKSKQMWSSLFNGRVMFSTYGNGKDIQVPAWALVNDI